MAMVTNRPVGAGVSVSQLFTRTFGAIAAWNDARVTRAALSRLSNHELDDLGLVRGDIDEIARGAYKR